MGYTSFSNQPIKYGVLCYPSNIVERKKTKFYNPLTNTETIISLLGVPLDTKNIPDVKKLVLKDIERFENAGQNIY